MRGGASVDEIAAAFGSRSLEVATDALDTCVVLCTEFNLSGDALADHWDAYSMNASVAVATKDALASFRTTLADKAIKKEKTKPIAKTMVKREPLGETPKKRSAAATAFQSPDAKQLKPSGMFSPSSFQSPPSAAEYAGRQNAGEVVDSFNAALKAKLSEETTPGGIKLKLVAPEKHMRSASNFMYTPSAERAIALDAQLVAFQEALQALHPDIEFGALGDPSPAPVTVVGRIVCEAAEGKLNSSVVQLEGARHLCGGQRVQLDLSKVPSFEVFPGKIVAVEGIYSDLRNPMTVRQVIDPSVLPTPTSTKGELRTLQNQHGGPVRIFTAAGPFTPNTDANYQPLQDLLAVAMKEQPDVVILVGPFIDANHASFKDGIAMYEDTLVSFDDIFLLHIMARINQLLAAVPHVHVVLIPSLRDVNHAYVYPQPPFEKAKTLETLESPSYEKRVHLMPNPCTFSVQGVVIGVTSSDILLELGGAELNRAPQSTQQRLFRLSEQVLRQKSFFPLFPSTAETPLDLKYLPQYQMPVTPDILILPSVLNRFCGSVQNTLCINPGQLSKGVAGGTYAQVTLLPHENLAGADADVVSHDVLKRAITEIMRI
ncbi:DNA polymerase subunit alpha B [Achlya hypogyna]|uniref:DNA polymerase alpha subunit B n=1 Tax=Achlya hypogyna TaxID=1202772 RepID=A0A1V9ZEM6_ACHHY|nr:DNA polymerase subunit alpha B [Achlya hypogyna]